MMAVKMIAYGIPVSVIAAMCWVENNGESAYDTVPVAERLMMMGELTNANGLAGLIAMHDDGRWNQAVQLSRALMSKNKKPNNN